MQKMKESEVTLELNNVPRGKGIIFKVVLDTSSGGLYFNHSKYSVCLCLWFIAFRIYFMSEAHHNYLQGLATLQECCSSHDIKLKKA